MYMYVYKSFSFLLSCKARVARQGNQRTSEEVRP
jgi:hypothetical protein